MPRRRDHGATTYFERSTQPLQALLFLLPLILVYELGIHFVAADATGVPTSDIYARSLMRDFFDVFGVAAYYLPALIVVVVLLSLHVARRDPWQVEYRLYPLMLGESIVLAIPLFVFGLVIAHAPQDPAGYAAATSHAGPHALQVVVQQTTAATPHTPVQQLVFSIGAGIYEELLFRLIGIALLHLLLVDILALPTPVGAAGAIVGSAVAFALYHFSSDNPFEIGLALYYTAAGLYFAVVYVVRGFGIVAGAHALYDVMVVLLPLALAARDGR